MRATALATEAGAQLDLIDEANPQVDAELMSQLDERDKKADEELSSMETQAGLGGLIDLNTDSVDVVDREHGHGCCCRSHEG